MAQRQKQSVFAIDQDDKVYVKLRAVMTTPLVALIDGLPITTFTGEKTQYLAIDVAIGWTEKEIKNCSAGERAEYERRLAIFRRVKAGDFKIAG